MLFRSLVSDGMGGEIHIEHLLLTGKGLVVLDVKTITGVAFRGQYHPIETVAEVEEFAAQAYASGDPLLLEIQLWARTNPRDYNAMLEHESTAFFKLRPERGLTAVETEPGGYPLPHQVSRAPFLVSTSSHHI